jgi:hypothetical protein
LRPIFLATVVLLASPAAGQDSGSSPAPDPVAQETAKLNARAARDTAAAAATTAATARLKAQTDALGLPQAEGKTSLGANAGLIEAWMLSTSTLDAAGQFIATDIRAADTRSSGSPGMDGPTPSNDPNAPPPPPTLPGRATVGAPRAASHSILLVPVDEPLALDLSENVAGQIADVRRLLTQGTPQYCTTNSVAPTDKTGGGIPLAVIGAGLNLLKTDTEISGVEVPLVHRMLVAATGRRLLDAGYDVIIPSAAVATPQRSVLAQSWSDLKAARALAQECRERFAKEKKSSWLTKKLAAFDAALASIDGLEAKLLKRDDNGQTPLAQAIRVEALMQGEPRVLRVAVEKGGGSILKRSNVWTALGAPAVGITGALVVSYSLTEPRSGQLLRSGYLVCRTALTNLRDVQNATVRRSQKTRAQTCTPSVLE